MQIACGVALGMVAYQVIVAVAGMLWGIVSAANDGMNGSVAGLIVVVLVAGAIYIKTRMDMDKPATPRGEPKPKP